MIQSSVRASRVLMKPRQLAAVTATGSSCDCKGYRYATISILLESAASTTATPAILRIEESDDASTWTTASGFNGRRDGTGDWTVPPNPVANYIIQLNVDLRKRKRYLRLYASVDFVAQRIAATMSLVRPESNGLAVSDTGAAAVVNG